MKQLSLLFSFIFFIVTCSFAQKSEIFKTSDGAIRGYDPVAYFKLSKPIKGDDKFTLSWKGANWKFLNQQNLEEFKANPDKYAPQYGGYCAYGTAEGHKASTEPQAWSIVNGKLYLNYDLADFLLITKTPTIKRSAEDPSKT